MAVKQKLIKIQRNIPSSIESSDFCSNILRYQSIALLQARKISLRALLPSPRIILHLPDATRS